MTDRPFAAKTRCPLSRLGPRSSASSRRRRRRRRRRRLAPSPAPHRTRRVDALPLESSIRIVPNRPEPPLLIVVHGGLFFSFHARGRHECVMHAHTLNRVRRSTNAKANAKARGRRHERARGGLIFVSRRHSSSRGRGDEQSRP
jgi:hypothetical protein